MTFSQRHLLALDGMPADDILAILDIAGGVAVEQCRQGATR